MIRRVIQAITLMLVAVFVASGYLGLRALVWRQTFQVEGMFQTGLVIAGAAGVMLGAAYVLLGRGLWRLLRLDWLSLQFGAILGALLYGTYNAITPLSPYSAGEPPLWRALQGGTDGLLIGLVLGAVVMVASQQPLHLDRGGLLRYLILFIAVVLLAWLVLLVESALRLPDAVVLILTVPLVAVLRIAVGWLDHRADSRVYR